MNTKGCRLSDSLSKNRVMLNEVKHLHFVFPPGFKRSVTWRAA